MPQSHQRLRLFQIVTAVIAVSFTIRLFYLQVIRGDFYKNEAISGQLTKFTIPAARGKIYIQDSQGQLVPIVLNSSVATIAVDPSFIDEEDREMVIDTLDGILDVDKQDIRSAVEAEGSSFEIIAKKVASEQAETVRKQLLKGVVVQDTEVRIYPEGQTAAHVLGFVDDSNQGQYGLEQYFNSDLSGRNGQLKAITDINGVPLPANDDNVQIAAQAGDDLTLTIDRSVQQFVEQKLAQQVEDTGAVKGSAIVMDPYTGQVIAMANVPTYDPSSYFDIEDISVFTNDVITGAYETGSGVKSLTMAMGLNEGAVSPETVFYDSGAKYIGDRVIRNADFSGDLDRTMTDVIKKSVNTGVVHVLEEVGGGSINDQAMNTYHDYLTDKFGLGSATGIGLAGEVGGTIIAPDEGEGRVVRYANMSFGQGMTVTMLQMASAYSALVNGGDYYKPQIVDRITAEDGTVESVEPIVVRSSIVSDQVSEQIKEMMYAVVDEGGGYTARRSGYEIGGKTGTAQIPDEFGGYAEGRFIGSFTGFGATDRGEYVVMTRIDEPTIDGYAGSVAAAPLFADISNFLIDHYQISPEGGTNE